MAYEERLWSKLNRVYFLKFYKLIYLLQRNSPPLSLPYKPVYEFSNVQSSDADHQLTFCSSGRPFSILTHREAENELYSTNFTFWRKYISHREHNPAIKGGVRALECIYHLKIASRRGRCELALCLDADFTIPFFIIPSYSCLLFLGAWSGPPCSTFD